MYIPTRGVVGSWLAIILRAELWWSARRDGDCRYVGCCAHAGVIVWRLRQSRREKGICRRGDARGARFLLQMSNETT